MGFDGTGENLRPSGAARELELAENLRPSGAAHELELVQAAAYEAEIDRLPSLGVRPSLSERAAEDSDGEKAGSGSADGGCRTAEDVADSAAPEAPPPRCGCMNGERSTMPRAELSGDYAATMQALRGARLRSLPVRLLQLLGQRASRRSAGACRRSLPSSCWPPSRLPKPVTLGH